MARLYQNIAIILLNSVLLIVGINLLIWASIAIRDWGRTDTYAPTDKTPLPLGLFHTDGTPVDNGKRTLRKLNFFDFYAYEGAMSETDISAMLDEFYDFGVQGSVYQPFVQTGPRRTTGRFLNVVTAHGFAARQTPVPDTAPNTDPIEVFAFGGSTTFGIGVPDDQTWPSHLSRILNARAQKSGLGIPVHVTNFGRTGYYPTQELYFLIEVLRSGARPELVVFLDGVNFGRPDDSPNLTAEIASLIETQNHKAEWWNRIPMMRLASSISRRFRPAEPSVRAGYDVDQLIEMFVQSKDTATQIAAHYGVETLFVLQPDANYNYPVILRSAGKEPISPRMKRMRTAFWGTFPNDEGYLDLSKLFSDWAPRKAIVDTAHYSPQFSEYLAQQIATQINLEDLARLRQPRATATGSSRPQKDD